MMSAHAPGKRPNRLIHEKSPYLLQHAYNPVDWYPWGIEAFDKAKREDKPVFLSIGYSTCYWCHVMEQESFDSPEIAGLINEHFVPIKVDREERPDLDAIYMTAVQAMTGQGGWPMTVLLTPDGKPFFGGTYFPPEERWGRPGLKNILPSIAQAWKTRRDEVLKSGDAVTQAIQAGVQPGDGSAPTAELLDRAAGQFAQQYDETYGGFGQAPKFPASHGLSLLLRVWKRSGDAETLKMVEGTLTGMARGGIHDQVGGGFHRYSTDAKWLVPHFEKMLYDQALLARTYLEAYQATRNPEYAAVARGIFTYVLRDLRDPGGAFYTAEDAGEVGREGEFYVWTPKELEQALGADDAARAAQFFGVTEAGNFEHGASILSVSAPPESFESLERVRAALLAARSRRPRPRRDDKILTDWNGLMIGALAYGARVLDDPSYAQAAAQAAEFLLARLAASPAAGGTPSSQDRDSLRSLRSLRSAARTVPPRLLHRYRDGAADVEAFLDDYAFLAWGLTDLYEATGDAKWLAEAKRLTQEMLQSFWDDSGGFLFSGRYNEQLIARTKELYDGAVPSGNSVAALDLVRLGHLLMDQALQDRAEQLFRVFAGHVEQAPQAFAQFLIAVDCWLGPSQEIVIAGDPAAPDTQRMLSDARKRFLPRAVVALHPAGAAGAAIERLVPFLARQTPIDGRATAYLCEQYHCQLPTTDPARFSALLDALQ